jgi:hypothetical protein
MLPVTPSLHDQFESRDRSQRGCGTGRAALAAVGVVTVKLSEVDREVMELLRVVSRGTWGMCGLYACLRHRATEAQIDASLEKLADARVIRSDSIGSWVLIPGPRLSGSRAGRRGGV